MGTVAPTGTVQSKLLPRLRLVVILSVIGLAGWGASHWASRPDEPMKSIEDDDLDSLILQEVTETASPPNRVATASFTNVVTADHREADDAGPAILQARFATESRPISNPSVWLTGTIEIDSSPADVTGPANPAIPHQDQPFTTK
ncbi:MAG: hypothetical protein JSS49_14385 [Planctomycetes bacterium]|nr:hypothetical protein [Planctomycetota bacterium]